MGNDKSTLEHVIIYLGARSLPWGLLLSTLGHVLIYLGHVFIYLGVIIFAQWLNVVWIVVQCRP